MNPLLDPINWLGLFGLVIAVWALVLARRIRRKYPWREPTTPAPAPAVVVAAAAIAPLYAAEDEVGVTKFLRRHHDLVALLVDARAGIDAAFGICEPRLALERNPDRREIELVVYIDAPVSPEEMVDRIDEFVGSWLVQEDRHRRLRHRVLFMTGTPLVT